MAYREIDDMTPCDRCKKTYGQRKKEPPMPTGINHPEYCFTTSFYLSYYGGVTCPECHKEMELESLFKLMDARKTNKE